MNLCKDCCEREITVKKSGRCNRCYIYFNRFKKSRPLSTKARINGGGCLRKDGYRSIQVNGIRKLEHTFVMEEKIGRKLTKGEFVHHKNGIRHDNRVENLELWSTSQPSGQRVEDKLKWCFEFIKLYESM